MPKPEREKIEYEFEDLRRNTDPVPGIVLAQLGFDSDGEGERQEGEQRQERRKKRKDDDEDDGSRDDDHDDRDAADDDLDDDEEVTLSRKELSRQLTETRRRAERKAREELEDARGEVTEVVGKLEKRLDGIERRGESDTIEAEFAPKIADLEAKLEEAMEKGNTKEVMALNKQLAEAISDKKLKLHDAKKVAATTRDSDEDDLTQQRGKRKVPRRVQRWIDKQDWFDDPKEAHVKAYLHKVDADLIEDGLGPSDDEYWEKLERKIERKFPGVLTLTTRGGKTDDEDDEDDDDDPRARRRRSRDDDEDEEDGDRDRDSKRDRQRGAARRSPVSDGGRGGGGRGRDRDDDGGGRRRGEVRLTKAHISNMRAFGLDPENKKHVEEYTLEVQRQQRSERR